MAKFYNKQRYSVTGRQHATGESIAGDILGASSAIGRFISTSREFDTSQSKELGDSLGQEMLMQYSQIKNATEEALINDPENFDYGNNVEAFKEFVPSWTAIAKEKFGDNSVAFKQFENYILRTYEASNSFANKINQTGAREASRRVTSTLETFVQNTDPSLITRESLEGIRESYTRHGGNSEQLSSTVTGSAIAAVSTKLNPSELFEDGVLSEDKVKQSVIENFGSLVKYDKDGNLVPANNWVRRVDVAKIKDFYSRAIGSTRQQVMDFELPNEFHKNIEGLSKQTEKLENFLSQNSSALSEKAIDDISQRIFEDNQVRAIFETGNSNAIALALDEGFMDGGEFRTEITSRQQKQLKLLVQEKHDGALNRLVQGEIFDEHGDLVPELREELRKMKELGNSVDFQSVRDAYRNLNTIINGEFDPYDLPSVEAELKKMYALYVDGFPLSSEISEDDISELMGAIDDARIDGDPSKFTDAQARISTRKFINSEPDERKFNNTRARILEHFDNDADNFRSVVNGWFNWGESINELNIGFGDINELLDFASEVMVAQGYTPRNKRQAEDFMQGMFTKRAGGWFGGRHVPKPFAAGRSVDDVDYRTTLEYIVHKANEELGEDSRIGDGLSAYENVDFAMEILPNGEVSIKELNYIISDSDSPYSGEAEDLMVYAARYGVVSKAGIGMTTRDIEEFVETTEFANFKKTREKQQKKEKKEKLGINSDDGNPRSRYGF